MFVRVGVEEIRREWDPDRICAVEWSRFWAVGYFSFFLQGLPPPSRSGEAVLCLIRRFLNFIGFVNRAFAGFFFFFAIVSPSLVDASCIGLIPYRDCLGSLSFLGVLLSSCAPSIPLRFCLSSFLLGFLRLHR